MVERYRGGSCCYHSLAVDFFSDSGSALCGYCIIEGTCLLGVLHKPSATQLFPLALHFAYKTIHMYVHTYSRKALRLHLRKQLLPGEPIINEESRGKGMGALIALGRII